MAVMQDMVRPDTKFTSNSSNIGLPSGSGSEWISTEIPFSLASSAALAFAAFSDPHIRRCSQLPNLASSGGV